MARTAFLFPGQASQKVGMGLAFYEDSSFARETFAQADEILGYRISRMCFEGPEEELKLTENTQPALLIVSFIAYSLFGVKPYLAAGHSLGEYSALVSAGALRFEDAVQIVHRRGQYMQQAVPVGEGAMAAVLGMEFSDVKRGLSAVTSGVVEIANWNSRDQVVIAGSKAAVDDALEELQAPRAVPLPVSAPFHCELMKSAEEKLAYDLDQIEFSDPRFPIITNVDARLITKGGEARDALKRQVSRTVLWYSSMELLRREGIAAAVELGSGNVLSGLLKRMARTWDSAPVITSVGDPESMDRARETLGGTSQT
jgi:[acyl-carrier-protein] S-malonyltransferase